MFPKFFSAAKLLPKTRIPSSATIIRNTSSQPISDSSEPPVHKELKSICKFFLGAGLLFKFATRETCPDDDFSENYRGPKNS